MKKNLCILMSMSVLLCSCGTKTEGIRLGFEITGPSYGSLAVVCRNEVYEITPDSLGKAVCELPEADAVYAKIFYGEDRKLIYMENGGKAVIKFDGNDFGRTFRMEGSMAPAAEYLNIISLAALPDTDYAMPFGKFVEKIKGRTEEAVGLLHAADLKGTGNFRKMEEARIRYSYGIQLLLYPTAHVLMTGNPDYVPDEDYYDVIRSYFHEDPMYKDIDEYREFMAESAHLLDPEGREIRELYPKLVAEMKYIAANCKDSRVKEALLHHIAFPYIDNFGTDSIREMSNIYRTYVDSAPLIAEFEAKCDRWDRKKPGRQSAGFTAEDMDGKTFSLEDFKGKYLYIDIWATWCRPCMMEVPYMEELEKQFEGRNITFLGLSVDSDKARWEAKVRSGEMPGIQLYLGNENDFLNAYEVRSIPRFILLDREGRIINPEMTRPSSEGTAGFLLTLEGI